MLAHYLELEGIATVVISLIRLHSEIIKPPRALFVPFKLGRPLGDPCDQSGQRAVLLAALNLLKQNGPVPVAADFPDAAPALPSADWKPAIELPNGTETPVNSTSLFAEADTVLPVFEQAKANRGRSTFGNSGLAPNQVVALVSRLLDGDQEGENRVPAKLLRFAIDDLKTLYLEAACPTPEPRSSAELGNWFWRQTIAGRAIA